jgi:hypothetical protein
MLSHSILPMKARIAPAREGSWRRTSHGSSAFSNETTLLQPQDGAELSTTPGTVSSIRTKLLRSEPEDARLTGVTRSLFRRLTGLNVMATAVPCPSNMALSIRKPGWAARTTAGAGRLKLPGIFSDSATSQSRFFMPASS